ncbi:MAG: glycosyltransferase [Clostridia bacterium]|nr:glycosyltransferase [Clostridia bacterium]
MKKKILFVYYTMMLGGSTTSLLSLLNTLDYEKYDVDLLLYRNEGPYIDAIPKQVNLLPQAFIPQSKAAKICKTIINGSLIRAYWHGLRYRHKFMPMSQSMAYAQLTFCRKIKQKYDVAIGFMELWSDAFVNLRVQADKKISWIHVDYEKAKYLPEIDMKMLSHSDNIVCVSDECLQLFKNSFPSLADRCVYIPNILTKKLLEYRSKEKVEFSENENSKLNLLSVCRLSINHKGLDRGVEVIKQLKECGYSVRWSVIGDGFDKEPLIEMIQTNGLENDIILLGQKENPYPYFQCFDAFFLPSRYEGKPMAVTEAQMLGLPVLVSEYASAREQIRDNEDGLIAENSVDGIFSMLKNVCENPQILDKMRFNVQNSNYDNDQDIQKFYDLLN